MALGTEFLIAHIDKSEASDTFGCLTFFSKKTNAVAKCEKIQLTNHQKRGIIIEYPYGGAMVSTGILKYDKRGEPGKLVNCPTLKINDNNTVAMAA